jgi:hypothetical protein
MLAWARWFSALVYRDSPLCAVHNNSYFDAEKSFQTTRFIRLTSSFLGFNNGDQCGGSLVRGRLVKGNTGAIQAALLIKLG